ncbi:hypothetical protein NGH46_12670 [Staphylococcus xylosus]|uniref:hypothetical protein n=1 Tax=Staphylococcus xylosus TaxID=1288 RepID=UPI002DB6D47A|nr:hypothetical protein [Staphylococcus xylosus]MEB8122979.1 hypothetical protein [Staphylococcus xylosus]
MNKNTVLDKGYFIATILNIFFLIGLFFINSWENLYIIIPYVIVMGLNAVYLVVKAAKINENSSI